MRQNYSRFSVNHGHYQAQKIAKITLGTSDRGEHISQMEPMLINESSPQRLALTDLALELTQKSAGLRRSLPESLVPSLANLVRSMNCYYSNLIEGHDTHPIDIERALKNDYSADIKQRDLRLRQKRISPYSNGLMLAGSITRAGQIRRLR